LVNFAIAYSRQQNYWLGASHSDRCLHQFQSILFAKTKVKEIDIMAVFANFG
jgi:hypothetical protein